MIRDRHVRCWMILAVWFCTHEKKKETKLQRKKKLIENAVLSIFSIAKFSNNWRQSLWGMFWHDNSQELKITSLKITIFISHNSNSFKIQIVCKIQKKIWTSMCVYVYLSDSHLHHRSDVEQRGRINYTVEFVTFTPFYPFLSFFFTKTKLIRFDKKNTAMNDQIGY